MHAPTDPIHVRQLSTITTIPVQHRVRVRQLSITTTPVQHRVRVRTTSRIIIPARRPHPARPNTIVNRPIRVQHQLVAQHRRHHRALLHQHQVAVQRLHPIRVRLRGTTECIVNIFVHFKDSVMHGVFFYVHLSEKPHSFLMYFCHTYETYSSYSKHGYPISSLF